MRSTTVEIYLGYEPPLRMTGSLISTTVEIYLGYETVEKAVISYAIYNSRNLLKL